MSKKNYWIIYLITVMLIGIIFILSNCLIKNLSSKSRELKKQKLTAELSRIEELYRLGKLSDVTIRNYVSVYFDLGKFYLKDKNFEQAISLYERGLRIDCWRPEKIFELGCAYKGKGQTKEAYERFKQVLSLRPPLLVYLRTKWELFKIAGRPEVRQEKKPAFPEGRLKDLVIYILPFGIKDNEMLEDLKVLLQDAFKMKFYILNPLPESAEGFNVERKQYFLEPLFRYVNKEYDSVFFLPGTQAILMVTSFDITDKGLNFLFGRTDEKTKLGIVSYYRFLLDRPDKKLLFKRLFTQSLSTTGFLLGLPRCSFPGCARSYSHSLTEFKRKSHKLCNECKNNLNRLLEKLKDYPEVDWSTEDLVRLESVKKKYKFE